MPRPPLPPEVEAVLQRPNPAIIGTVRPDGQPVTVATWYLYEDARVLFNLDAARRRLDYLRDEPRVSLTVLNGTDWYSHVSMQGRVTAITDDTDLTDVDRMARHYTGRPYANRDRKRVDAWMEIDTYHVWGDLGTPG